MAFLGIDIRFSDQTIIWEGADMPFKPADAAPNTHYHIAEAMATSEAADRIKEILDAKYEAADLEKVCSSQSHLALAEQRQPLALLNKCAGKV